MTALFHRQRTFSRSSREDFQKLPLILRGAWKHALVQTGVVPTRERVKPRPNSGENTQERIGTKSIRTPPSRGLEDVKPSGTVDQGFLEELCLPFPTVIKQT